MHRTTTWSEVRIQTLFQVARLLTGQRPFAGTVRLQVSYVHAYVVGQASQRRSTAQALYRTHNLRAAYD